MKTMKMKAGFVLVALTGVFAFANAATATPALVAQATTASTAIAASAFGHRAGGYWTQVWVLPVYQNIPQYDCYGRFIGYRTVMVRLGYWRSVWNSCNCCRR